MHHCDDEDCRRLGPIEKTVGKSTNENATETPGEPMTDLRVSRDGPCNASHFSEEFQSEPRGLSLVKLAGGDQFRFSVRVETDALHRSADRAFRKTLAVGRPP
jgi:hypothetical protein